MLPPCPSAQKLDGCFVVLLLPPALWSRECCTSLHSFILTSRETNWLSVEEMKVMTRERKKKKKLTSVLRHQREEGKTKTLLKFFVICFKYLQEKQIEHKIFSSSYLKIFEDNIQYIYWKGRGPRKTSQSDSVKL